MTKSHLKALDVTEPEHKLLTVQFKSQRNIMIQSQLLFNGPSVILYQIALRQV